MANEKPKGNTTKSVVACVRLTPHEAQLLEAKYGSVGKALKVLTASIVRR